jgi:DTW domain-containing protein YfiP
VHLGILAPRCRLLDVGSLPALDPTTTVLLFPDDCAVPADSVDASLITDVVVIDSKWGQARGVMEHPALRGIRHVRLGAYRTSYWRYHTKGVPDDGLCTVEAVYFLCRELHARRHPPGEQCACMDDLMWYFAFQHRRVHAASDARIAKRTASAMQSSP